PQSSSTNRTLRKNPREFLPLELGIWDLFGIWILEFGIFPTHHFMSSQPNLLDLEKFQRSVNRRSFLQRSAYGLGCLALASLLDRTLLGSASAATGEGRWTGMVNPPHFPVRAK